MPPSTLSVFVVKSTLLFLFFLPTEAFCTLGTDRSRLVLSSSNKKAQAQKGSIPKAVSKDRKVEADLKTHTHTFAAFAAFAVEKSNARSCSFTPILDHTHTMLNSIIKVISAQRRNSIIQGVRNRRPHSFLLASSQLPSATATATATSRQYATRLFSSSNMSEVPIVSTSISDNESAATFTPSSEKDGKQHTLYEELVRKLYMTNLYNPVKLGLENTVKLHEVLGSPLNNVSCDILPYFYFYFVVFYILFCILINRDHL